MGMEIATSIGVSAPMGSGGGSLFGAVEILLLAGGSDASTVITDSSSFARAYTAGGNAQIDTTNQKFGGKILFDGAGDYVSGTGLETFKFLHEATVAYTVEGWIDPVTTGTFQYLFDTGGGATANLGIQFALYNDGSIYSNIAKGAAPMANTIKSSSGAITFSGGGNWQFIRMTYDPATNFRGIAVDGTTVTSSTSGSGYATGNQTNSLNFGRYTPTSAFFFKGGMSNMRIVKGTALPLDEVPTEAFPTS